MKKLLIIFVLFVSFKSTISAQSNTCSVKMEKINGTYTGECANGLANGTGKSIGTDQYEGNFKKGYPEGKGMYIWADGHYFMGNFKKGIKEGAGEMYYESVSGQDSVIKGFWKKDDYVGQFEKPYEILNITSRITKVDCSVSDKNGDNILITVHQRTNQQSVSSARPNPPPTVAVVNVVLGTFYTKNNQSLSNSSVTKIQEVSFPFKAVFILSNGEQFEMVFHEKSNYELYVDIL